MRILITTGIFEPESGGPATYTPQLASKLFAAGHEVTVITYSDAGQFDDSKYPFKLIRVVRGNPPPHKATGGLGKILNRINFFFAVLKVARDCDMIYTLDWFAAGLPVALGARLLGKPYIVRVGGDYLWEQKYLESGSAPVSLKDFYERRLFESGEYAIAFRSIRFVLRGAVHVVFNSDTQRDLYVRFYGLDPQRVSTIYNPTPDAGTLSAVRTAPTKRFVFWGRLIVMKNVESLIRAFAQAVLPAEYTLTIIGDGPQKIPLQRIVGELHLESRVEMLSSMDKASVLEYVKDARAFILPSWTDISPNQVYEALAIGLPSLVTKENYLPIYDQLPDMIDPRSVDDIAQKLTMLADDARYAAFAGQCKAIHFGHDWEMVTSEHIALFEAVTSGKVRPSQEQKTILEGQTFQASGIRVLQIGADRSKRGILYPESPAVMRQKAYGEYFGALDIIGFSLTGDKRVSFETSTKVHVYPTNSMSRLLYGLDTIHIARQLPRPDVISVQDPFETGLLGALMSWMMGVPLHVQVHTDLLSPAYARHSLLNRVRVSVAWFVLGRATRIRVVSERIKQSLEGQWGIKTPITVLPIFADLDRIKNATLDTTLSMRFVTSGHKILVVARLEPEKNVALAIHAFAQVAPADACLIIVGDGSEHGHLISLVQKLNIKSQVFFEGEKESLPYYGIADLVLVTSQYEGYGLVIVEALAAGKPVLSTDVGCARAMGAIVADPPHFAQALAAWLAVKGDHPRGNGIQNYPYKHFEEYAKAYTEDIAACLPVPSYTKEDAKHIED